MTDRQTDTQTNRETDGHTDRQTRWTHRHTDKQDKHDRQKHRQTTSPVRTHLQGAGPAQTIFLTLLCPILIFVIQPGIP